MTEAEAEKDYVKEHKLISLNIEDVRLDPSNPNQMTPEQMNALRKSMETFGYLAPIIVDQDNLIADGEHRLTIYREYGYTVIPAYRVNFSDDNERRMLRQTMNKLKGYHDSELDAAELKMIAEAGRLGELAEMIAQDDKKMADWLSDFNEAEGAEVNPIEKEMETTNECPKCHYRW